MNIILVWIIKLIDIVNLVRQVFNRFSQNCLKYIILAVFSTVLLFKSHLMVNLYNDKVEVYFCHYRNYMNSLLLYSLGCADQSVCSPVGKF